MEKLITGVCDDGLIYTPIPENFKDLKDWGFKIPIGKPDNETHILKFINNTYYLNRGFIINFIKTENFGSSINIINDIILNELYNITNSEYNKVYNHTVYGSGRDFIIYKIVNKYNKFEEQFQKHFEIVDCSYNFVKLYNTETI